MPSATWNIESKKIDMCWDFLGAAVFVDNQKTEKVWSFGTALFRKLKHGFKIDGNQALVEKNRYWNKPKLKINGEVIPISSFSWQLFVC